MDTRVTSVDQPIYQALAEAFAAEGVDAHFLLTGHGQMHWAVALSELLGVNTYTVRHEHAAVAMATGYYFATGKVGVASTTCGPGFTQVMTALTSAVQAHVPLVIFTADAPLGERWYNQTSDQAALTKATGAHFIAAHSPDLMLDYVQEAFYTAKFEKRPVVFSVPYDLLEQPMPHRGAYVPSAEMLPKIGPMPPNPVDIDRAVKALAAAKRPVVVAGRGAMSPNAAAAIEALAEKCGALLGTTLPARGLFDHHPYSIGVVGGLSSEIAKELLRESDCVVTFGASLTYFTTYNGRIFPNAKVIQVDSHPRGLYQGRRSAEIHVRSDATLGAQAIADRLPATQRSHVRTAELARAIAERPADGRKFDIDKGTIDPRDAIEVLDRLIPKDWDIIGGTGNNAFFYTHMKGRHPRNFHVIREFGAIGSALSMAIGVAAARNNGKVVLLDGDGSLMMHIQELDTMQRHGIKLLIVALNDGGFGAEFHRLRPEGKDDRLAFFGRPDFAAIGKVFGFKGATITDVSQIEPAFRDYDPDDVAMVLNLHISDKVPNTGKKQLGKAQDTSH